MLALARPERLNRQILSQLLVRPKRQLVLPYPVFKLFHLAQHTLSRGLLVLLHYLEWLVHRLELKGHSSGLTVDPAEQRAEQLLSRVDIVPEHHVARCQHHPQHARLQLNQHTNHRLALLFFDWVLQLSDLLLQLALRHEPIRLNPDKLGFQNVKLNFKVFRQILRLNIVPIQLD